MALRKDIWRTGIAGTPLSQVIADGTLAGAPITWLPDPGPFRFLADPFGLWRDDLLHLFVEAYDYRVRVGAIEVLTFDAAFDLRSRCVALREPWHLSYPHVFEADGETWMLPEAHRSGRLTLYRARDFPLGWEAVAPLELPENAVDATPVLHEGRWWLFYSPATSEYDKMGTLHAAFAERLTGPWRAHPGNPIRRGRDGSRPAGRAIVEGERIMLPVQDCRRTYGGGTRVLQLRISPTAFESELGEQIGLPDATAPYDRGLHTLSAAGAVTLFDIKRIDLSPRGALIEASREFGKFRRRFAF